MYAPTKTCIVLYHLVLYYIFEATGEPWHVTAVSSLVFPDVSGCGRPEGQTKSILFIACCFLQQCMLPSVKSWPNQGNTMEVSFVHTKMPGDLDSQRTGQAKYATAAGVAKASKGNVCIHIYIYICHVCIDMYICIYKYIYTCLCVCTCTCTFI